MVEERRRIRIRKRGIDMFPWKLRARSVLALGVCGWVTATSGGSRSELGDPTKYLPIQSISYEFGSKLMSGYFVQEASTCLVTLMITENSDPEHLLPVTATRVRLVMNPGQIAGLDSEEGHSVNFTCGEAAATLVVDFGGRARLVAAQKRALPKSLK
jgi:hypothetical protein